MDKSNKSKKELQVIGGVFLILIILLLSGVFKDDEVKKTPVNTTNPVKTTEEIQREALEERDKREKKEVEKVKENYEKGKTTYDPDQQKIYDELYKKNLETEKNKNIK